jgi:hypothetical protein
MNVQKLKKEYPFIDSIDDWITDEVTIYLKEGFCYREDGWHSMYSVRKTDIAEEMKKVKRCECEDCFTTPLLDL